MFVLTKKDFNSKMDCVEVKQETTVKKEVEDNTYLFDGNNDGDNTNDPFNSSSDESICDNSDNDPFKEDEDYQLKHEDPFEVNNTKVDKIPQETPILNESSVKETSSTGATLQDYIDLPNYEYGCKHCDYVTKIRPYVFKHLKRKHMNYKYCRPIKQCPHCPYKTKFSLKYHIISRHKKENEVDWFQCHQCGYKSTFKSHFMNHLLTHKTYEEKLSSMIKCNHCSKMYQTKSDLSRHIRAVHDENKPNAVRCHLCGHKYSNKHSLNTHFKKYHGSDENLEILRCKKCSYKTKIEYYLEAHVRKHDKRIQCEKCPYQTHDMGHMKLHQINHQEVKNEKDLKFSCDKCDYKTYRHYSLKVHKLNHLKPAEIQYFYCYHCDFKAKRKDNLKTHIQNHFKKKTEFVCYICDFKTNIKVSHIAHLGKHSREQNEKQNSKTNHVDKKEKEKDQSSSFLRTTRSQKNKLEKSS